METTKYAHLSVTELKEAVANAERLVAEQEENIKGYVKDMAKKKNTISDIKSINHRITYAFERKAEYEGWVEEYTEALKRAERVEEGHGQIVEFLEFLLEQDMNWYSELKADYKEKGHNTYREMVRKNEITKVVMTFATMTSQEALKTFKQDLDVRYKKLVMKVTKKVGKVKEIKVRRNWNEGFDGVVIGEDGECLLQTILAGGFNIQRLHYRTIVK